jgi:hypothetical protein
MPTRRESPVWRGIKIGTSLQSAPANASSGYSPSTNLGGLSFDFITTQLGWAGPAGEPDLMQTLNGGRTWTSLTPQVTGVPPSR